MRYSIAAALPISMEVRYAGTNLARLPTVPQKDHVVGWRVIIIRSKGGPDRERAEAVAIRQFDLDQDQRSRLLIRSR